VGEGIAVGGFVKSHRAATDRPAGTLLHVKFLESGGGEDVSSGNVPDVGYRAR
jgi:hypothetical protein